jgi:tetratricopeptide (TPR) repeat protein
LWLPRLSAEFDNARSALSWARRKGEPRAAGIIAAAICRWGFACGLLGEARACAESELERGELDDHPDVAARLWSALGILTWGAQRVTFCERAAAVFRERGDRPRLAICAIRLGGGYHQTGDYGRAEAALREARAILREIGAERSAQAALALSWHATVLRTTNRLSEARDLLTDSIRIFERLGDEARAVGEKINLAELEFTAGDSQRAFALVREAIEGLRAADASGFQMSNSVQVQVTALHNAAAYAIALNDDQSASLYAREALLAARLSGGGTLTIPSIQHLATVAAMQRRTSTGARLCGYCDEALQRYEIVRELTEQRAYNKLVHLLFAQANELDIARWRLAGAAMTENEAIDLALSG